MRPPPPVQLHDAVLLKDTLDRGEPPRLLASDAGLSEAARSLLLSPPPVKPLDAATAMRVRAAVLQMPGPVLPKVKHHTSPPPSTLAYLKLGAVAGAAALFGAGVMTLASGYLGPSTSDFGSANDRSGVVVVSGLEGIRNPALPSDIGRAAEPKHLSQTSTSPIERGLEDGEPQTGPMDGHGSTQLPAEAQARVGSALGEGGHDSAKSHHDDATVMDATSGLPGHAARAATDRRVGPEGTLAPVLSVNDLESISDEPVFAPGPTRNVRVRPAFRKISAAQHQEAAAQSHGATARHYRAAAQPKGQAALGARTAHANSRLAHSASNNLEAETLLLEDARSKLGREPEAALALALEHQARYRRGQLLEQRRMIHLEALLRLGRDEEALALAKTIGNSLYQARATALLAKYGI